MFICVICSLSWIRLIFCVSGRHGDTLQPKKEKAVNEDDLAAVFKVSWLWFRCKVSVC